MADLLEANEIFFTAFEPKSSESRLSCILMVFQHI